MCGKGLYRKCRRALVHVCVGTNSIIGLYRRGLVITAMQGHTSAVTRNNNAEDDGPNFLNFEI